MTRLWEEEGADLERVTDEARIFVWGIIQMAEQGIAEQLLFNSATSGKSGRCFSLIPSPRSLIPLQWAHFGPGAISDALANTPCHTLDVDGVLRTLNDVLGSDHTLAMPGLRPCLEHFLCTSQDFGYLYGIFRGHWHADFVCLLSDLSRKQVRDEEMRRNVLREGYIKDSNIRPRRAWDLYSNRVLPYYALPSHPCVQIPDNLWTVSHSWVSPEERAEVWTPINGSKWPVPLPHATSLDHIRVELLNFGAEYVWLDVLCLRQKGRPEDEEQRKDEWKLDVPTIGSIYALPSVPCITYFNGLGLVADASEEASSSDRHWYNRVWTVQEYSTAWLPGGATGASSTAHESLYCRYSITMNPVELASRNNPSSDLFTLSYVYDMMRKRHATTELDRVFGLAYVFGCKTLPVYDEGCSPDLALAMLFKHIPASTRTSIFLQHIEAHPDDTAILLSILPSWNQLMGWAMVPA
ncbi:hypothetical protein PsYK624_144040 [Phanerochaete sordida]|uniref:Heterokaryon incompatibility domain-containing protein n=1 Tax=Phanerochaete sordida TaxID=48140 RepID=A0A9P3GMK5_9APHY|nr:hypothetical protein PsYK624_144040 [Phanerochaete sordida]